MSRFRIFLTFIALLSLVQNTIAQTSKQKYEILRLIRQEKFDLIMPDALRDNNVDMWMHVVKDGDPDPLDLDFGGQINWSVTDTLGIYIFTDRGGDRIERAIFGGTGDRTIYDIFGTQRDLREFVEERDPRVIAVNMSKWLSVADGLSHTAYLRLVELLGDKYANRLISSENVLTDFRVRRVQREIIAFANACEMQRQIQEEALRRIEPGISTREDIGWWAMDQVVDQGMSSERFNRGHGGPGVMHSEVSNGSETGRSDYIFQRGDLISWDWGLKYLNFGTDWKRNAYILREGETRVPDGVQHAWDRGLRAHEIIRKNIRTGRTAAATLNAVIRALEDEGYIYTPSADAGSQYRDLMNALEDNASSGFSLDCHTVGNTGNSEVASGPSFAAFRSGRGHIMIQPNNLFRSNFW